MHTILAAELTKSGLSIHQDGDLLLALKLESGVLAEIDMRYNEPQDVYRWVELWTGLWKHDFELRIEYPPFHIKHPKGMLPEVLGEKRKPYLHTFE